MKRTPLTLEQHRFIGEELKAVHLMLSKYLLEISEAYGPNSKESRMANSALTGVDNLRGALDSRVFQLPQVRANSDHRFGAQIYYGTEGRTKNGFHPAQES